MVSKDILAMKGTYVWMKNLKKQFKMDVKIYRRAYKNGIHNNYHHTSIFKACRCLSTHI